ncbi:hypothetical protein [Aminivibrio sp.]
MGKILGMDGVSPGWMLGAVICPSLGVPEKPGIAMPPSPPAPGEGPSWA